MIGERVMRTIARRFVPQGLVIHGYLYMNSHDY